MIHCSLNMKFTLSKFLKSFKLVNLGLNGGSTSYLCIISQFILAKNGCSFISSASLFEYPSLFVGYILYKKIYTKSFTSTFNKLVSSDLACGLKVDFIGIALNRISLNIFFLFLE